MLIPWSSKCLITLVALDGVSHILFGWSGSQTCFRSYKRLYTKSEAPMMRSHLAHITNQILKCGDLFTATKAYHIEGVKIGKPTQTKPYLNGFKFIWVMVLTNPFDKWIGSGQSITHLSY